MGEKEKGEAKWQTHTRGVTPHRFGWQQPPKVNPRCTQPPGAGGSCCSFWALLSSCPSEGHELEARFHRGWWSPGGISRAGATVTACRGEALSSMSEPCAPSDPLPRLRCLTCIRRGVAELNQAGWAKGSFLKQLDAVGRTESHYRRGLLCCARRLFGHLAGGRHIDSQPFPERWSTWVCN